MLQTMEKEQKNTFIRVIIAILLFVAVLVLEHTGAFSFLRGKWYGFLPYLVPYAVVGYEPVIEAFEKIFHGELFDEDFLMTVATFGAFAIGENAEGVAVMILFIIGELFEDVAVDRSRASIAAMMDIHPEYANVMRGGKMIEVDPGTVQLYETVAVKPGERVPLDGVVMEGESTLDTSSLTGESKPKTVRPGDEVISGCINRQGSLMVRVTKTYENSTVSKILQLVEEAEERKAPAENFITRFARVYTPIVTVAALILALVPPLLFNAPWQEWLRRACTFLVISCPCALVISIPLSFFGGIGAASKIGVLVKGSNFLEALTKVKTFVFDKTGTLTKGEFAVKRVEGNVLSEIAMIESFSTHPLAAAILKYYGKVNGGTASDTGRVSDYSELNGKGVRAKIDGTTYFAGNAMLMREERVDFPEVESTGTVIYAARRTTDPKPEYLGFIEIADSEKDGAKEALESLKKYGVEKTVMLTGDRREAAEIVGRNLKIDRVAAELLPEAKVSELALEDAAAFVGDGMNDAPVLMKAEVGIAMGALGSDAAIEAADIVLMDDDIRKIPKTLKIAEKTLRIVKQNIALALGIKALVLILGAFGIASMWLAIFADVGVMILAVLNAMRVLSD